MTIRDAAFSGMTGTAYQAAIMRRRVENPRCIGDQAVNLAVELADLQCSISDWRIALALANGLLPAMLDRNGHGAI